MTGNPWFGASEVRTTVLSLLHLRFPTVIILWFTLGTWLLSPLSDSYRWGSKVIGVGQSNREEYGICFLWLIYSNSEKVNILVHNQCFFFQSLVINNIRFEEHYDFCIAVISRMVCSTCGEVIQPRWHGSCRMQLSSMQHMNSGSMFSVRMITGLCSYSYWAFWVRLFTELSVGCCLTDCKTFAVHHGVIVQIKSPLTQLF